MSCTMLTTPFLWCSVCSLLREEVTRLLGAAGMPPDDAAVLQGAVLRLVALCPPLSPYADRQASPLI